MGYVSLDVQYIDGTKIEISSNRYRFVWRKSIERYKTNLHKKIDAILSQIEEGIIHDSQDDTPEFEPMNSNVLKEKIKKLNQSNQEKTRQEEKLLKELSDKHLPKLEEYEKKLSEIGDHL